MTMTTKKILERKSLSGLLAGVFLVEEDGRKFWRHEYKRKRFEPGKPQVAYDDYDLGLFKSIDEFAGQMDNK
jgi:hypothetical protein